jgi:hypothetical protein
LEHFPAKEYFFMIEPKPFSTAVQCGKIFTSINKKYFTIVKIPEGCSMIFGKQTELEIKHFKRIWELNVIFTD